MRFSHQSVLAPLNIHSHFAPNTFRLEDLRSKAAGDGGLDSDSKVRAKYRAAERARANGEKYKCGADSSGHQAGIKRFIWRSSPVWAWESGAGRGG